MPNDDAFFATTQWRVVLEASDRDAGLASGALEELCRKYWEPLYAYLRRLGCTPPDAEDLTQGFLARLLAKDGLRAVHPRKGKFRSFLLVSLKHYLANEGDKLRAQKRGGGHVLIPLDDHEAEEGYKLEPADQLTPEKIYDRRWAYAVLEQTRRRLAEEYTKPGKRERFHRLAAFLPGERPAVAQAQIAKELGMSEGAVKVEVHRLRQRYAAILRRVVAQTVGGSEEVDEELRYLIDIVSE
jgi:RNA polymerase sigma factor (sigma-70 family)